MDPKLVEVTRLFDRLRRPPKPTTSTSPRPSSRSSRSSSPSSPASPRCSSRRPTPWRSSSLRAVILSVKMEDQDAFERDFCQLKPYYMDTCGTIPPSSEEYPIMGANLLRLLVQNRIAEFHTELELLPAKALDNAYIKHGVELEQSFMEGAYNRVLSARQTAPHETYIYFMDLLVRRQIDEIAGCSEKGYDYLSINDAKQMFKFSSDKELQQYIAEEHPEWDVKDGRVLFQKAKESQPCKEIPAAPVINQTLGYARELERIV
ncbi:hypothetical protein VPH35_112522 [Triticum aestivum]